MIEHAIQHNAHAELIGMLDQIVEILLGAEVRIDLEIILRIIRVIGARIEDRVEVQRIDTERLQIFQFLIDAL